MNTRDWTLVATLAVGNLLVWGERLVSTAAPMGFDFGAFEQAARDNWKPSKLVSRPFAPNGVIPESHLHLRADDDKDPLYSIYLGQYPRLGILHPEPHDPQICYQAAGYDLLAGPDDILLAAGDRRHAVKRIEVRRTRSDGEILDLTTYYWHQLAGRMPGTETGMPGAMVQARARYLEGRSDLVWVRVEFRGRGRHLDAALRKRLLALMQNAASAMRH